MIRSVEQGQGHGIRRTHVNVRPPSRWSLAAAGLLSFHALMLAHLARVHSPSIDEVAHLPAGIVIWTTGRFDLYRVNPPLVKALAAIPAVLLASSEIPEIVYDPSPELRPEWNVGRTFIAEGGGPALALWTYGRWACIPLSVLGGFLCYRWASELFSPACGLAALIMWCFCPNILGNGAMITPDLGATSLGLFAAYAFSKWLSNPSYRSAVLAGLATGAAELAKMTWIVLFLLWPVLYVVYRKVAKPGTEPMPTVFQLLTALFLGVDVLLIGYLGNGVFVRLDDYEFQSALFSGRPLGEPGQADSPNRFSGSWLEGIPVPLPADYVIGMDAQRADFENKKWSYLFGEFRHGGWWYYYIIVILLKMPLGFLLLAAAAVGTGSAWLMRRSYGARRAPRVDATSRKIHRCPGTDRSRSVADFLVLTVVPLCVFVFVSSQTGFSRYLRYVLPVFPFVYVGASGVALTNGVHTLSAKSVLVWSLVAYGCASSLWQFPHSLSYANELAGGPRRADRFIADANLSWGQDAFFLRDWIREHPDARPITVGYLAAFDLKAVGIDHPMPPLLRPNSGRHSVSGSGYGPQPGWHVLDVQYLRSHKHSYDYFHNLQPVDYIAGSMRVYHLTRESAEELRRELPIR